MWSTLLPVPVLMTVSYSLSVSAVRFSSGVHLASHPRVRRTLALLQQCFWWSSMEEDTKGFINACQICFSTRILIKLSPAFLILYQFLIALGLTSIDFVAGLPTSANNTVILIIVDQFSKTAQLIPLPRETTEIKNERVATCVPPALPP